MARYELEATDGGKIYSIPQGETMIGRGAFLGIADKKVSRNHAILEMVNDKLRIKPIHVNPCFYRASHKDTYVPLEKNEWCWLHSDDCISLLPDKFSFRVIAPHLSEDATLRNSQALDEGYTFNNDSPCTTTHHGAKTEVDEPSCSDTVVKSVSPPPSAKCSKREEKNCSDLPSAVNCKVDIEQSKPAPRKRTLPKWMLQSDLMIHSLPSPVVKAGKKRRNVTVNRTGKNEESVTEKKQLRTVKSGDVEIECLSKKSKAAVQTEDLPGTSSDTVSARVQCKSSVQFLTNNEEEEMAVESYDFSPCPSPKMESNSSPSGSTSAKQCEASDSEPVNNVISQSARSPQTSQQATKRRTPCVYAERCYRKNPVHFQEFCHPGDSDYNDVESGSQDDNDERPECPYGTDCYRKNPQHKLDYKHTKPPGRRLRKRTTKKAKGLLDNDSDNDGEPNEYDLEDSFIDDDDEEEDFTDEDSDWMPDSEERGSEDVDQLLKEAKRFVKGKH